jgi:tRNA G37 N-methylase Trm5
LGQTLREALCKTKGKGYNAQVANIENEFRVSDLEVVAGSAELETEVRQYNTRFRLNYSEVL